MILNKVAINEGTVIREVFIRESTAKLNNANYDSTGFKYVPVDEPKKDEFTAAKERGMVSPRSTKA